MRRSADSRAAFFGDDGTKTLDNKSLGNVGAGSLVQEKDARGLPILLGAGKRIPAEDGQILEFRVGASARVVQTIELENVMVDGLGVGDVGNVVLRDRQHLSEDGIFVIITLVDAKTGRIRNSPDIISRGFVYLKESQELLKEVRQKTKVIVESITTGSAHPINWTHVKDNLRDKIGQYLFSKTLRRPMVLPVVIEV